MELVGELRSAAFATTDACIDLGGYQNRPNVRFQGRMMEASRAVWWIANGDPGEKDVLHTCHRGEEGCISIRHLYAGNYVQNVRDRVRAGRSCQGIQHWATKLSDVDVAEIRRRFRPGNRWNPGNAIALGDEFGVSAEQVSRVARGSRRNPPALLMVGDRPEDAECAEAAGLDFQDAVRWRSQAFAVTRPSGDVP